jgi:competence protein ComFC
MSKLLTGLLNIIFPPRETEIIVQENDVSRILKKYSISQTRNIHSLSRYQDSTIKALIVENKFYKNTKASKLLASLMSKWAEDQSGETLYIPIPLGQIRFKERGYNQVQTILDGVQNISIDNSLLKRIVDTEPQTQQNKQKRETNMKGAFVFNSIDQDLAKYSQVVLVDDVVTTGATLNEARSSIAPHLPPHTRITCVAIAH